MIVVLQQETLLERTRPNEERFKEALLGMRVPADVVSQVILIIEFRNMIPPAGFLGRSGRVAKILIRTGLLENKAELNRAVAHELKHLSFSIHRRSDRQQKWDEVDCGRAENKWGKVEYFLF